MSLIICIKSVIFLGLVTDGGLTGTRYFAFLPRTRDQQLPGWADPLASDTRHGAAPLLHPANMSGSVSAQLYTLFSFTLGVRNW